jgi:hypothetical protein
MFLSLPRVLGLNSNRLLGSGDRISDLKRSCNRCLIAPEDHPRAVVCPKDISRVILGHEKNDDSRWMSDRNVGCSQRSYIGYPMSGLWHLPSFRSRTAFGRFRCQANISGTAVTEPGFMSTRPSSRPHGRCFDWHAARARHQIKFEFDQFRRAVTKILRPHAGDAVAQAPLQRSQ